MLKKIFTCAALLVTLVISGCGEEKISGSPDKAVLAYAEISMTGDSDNMSAAGFTEDDRKEIRANMAKTFVDSMKSITPLSDESAQEITKIYFDKLKGSVTFKSTLRKNDAERPVVELVTTPVDQGETARTSVGKNDELIALIGMVGKLKSDGATDEQLKENPDVQALAITALTKYIDNIRFQPEKSLDVLCVKVTGRDGNVHWAPSDSGAFVNFLTGQN